MWGILSTTARKGIPEKHDPIEPHAQAIFRLLFGVLLVSEWLFFLWETPRLSVAEWLLFGGMLLLSGLLMVGAWMRVTAFLLGTVYWLQWMLLKFAGVQETMVASEGQALLFFFLLMAVAVSSGDRWLSIAMQRQYGTFVEWEYARVESALPLKLILSGAYAWIGAVVLQQPLWMSGTRLRSALVGSLGTGIAARTMRTTWSTDLLAWILRPIQIVLLILPIGLWLQKIRIPLLWLALLIHLSIVIFLGKWWLCVLAAGLPLFMDSLTVRCFFERKNTSTPVE